VKNDNFPHSVYKYYHDAKTLRKKSSYDFSMNFDKTEALECINHAEEFINESKRFLPEEVFM